MRNLDPLGAKTVSEKVFTHSQAFSEESDSTGT